MPYQLDDIDIEILKSLIEDGTKSHRQIARELKVSTPTVNSHIKRLFNLGIIKSISPILDTTKLVKESKTKLEECHCVTHVPEVKMKKGMKVEISCDYCDGPTGTKPHVFKFADQERFFCCSSCKALYKEKYKGRIESLIKNQ